MLNNWEDVYIKFQWRERGLYQFLIIYFSEGMRKKYIFQQGKSISNEAHFKD